MNNEDEKKKKKMECCGNCALCVHTYLGSECGLTDNAVSDCQPACLHRLYTGGLTYYGNKIKI